MTGAIEPRGSLKRQSAAAAAGAAALGVAGGVLTDIGPWYWSLKFPSWKPSDVIFPAAWTAIFACTAVAGVIAWRRTPDKKERRTLLAAFALNGALNVAWSALFFKAKRPDWALVEVVPLWGSIALLMALTGKRSRAAPALLTPYLGWVTFAAALNAEIVRLNGPFR